MGSKFLNGSGNVTYEDLTNGSFQINAAQIQLSNLIPNLPVKADASQKLYSTYLTGADISGVLVNPYVGTIEATDFESVKYFSINDELQKIDNLGASTANNTNVNGRLNITGEMSIPKITDPTELTRIELDDTDINIISQNLTFNGSDLLSATGTNQQYIMGDGSLLQYSQNSGNSNFYLYNNGTDQDPTPANGIITYNTVIQDNATFIYINHRTRDTIDIEVFFKNISTLNDVYIQDQENSDNNITYNITGTPIIINQAQITIPVVKTTSNGTGATNFGNGHNLLLSFFTNSIEVDLRLSTLESKTQNFTANNNNTIFTKTILHNIDVINSFNIRNSTDGTNVLDVSRTIINAFKQLHMQNQPVTNASGYATQGGLSSGFLKANGTIDSSPYITAANSVITNLQNKTQNQNGSLTGTDFTNNFNVILRVANGDFFTIRNDATPVSTNKFNVSNTSVQISSIPLQMNNQKIQFLGTPADPSDATRKDYVDNLITPLQTATQNLTASSVVSTFRKDIQFKLDGLEAFVVSNNAFIPVNKLLVTNTSVEAGVNLTAPAFIKTGGLTTQFLKANGDIDGNTYLTSTSIQNKLSIDGSIAMTGALNMGNQAINNSGIISAVGFVKNSGLGSEFLKANGASDSRIMTNLQVLQSAFQVGANGVITEVNLTASPDKGSYTWTDGSNGFTRKWKFHAISTRGLGLTSYTMRFKSSLGTMLTWNLPTLPTSTNQPIEITMTVTRRLNTQLAFYGSWDCSSTGTAQGFRIVSSSSTNIPDILTGSTYNVSIQSDNPGANITFLYIEVENIFNG